MNWKICSLIESPNYSLLRPHMVAWLVAGQRVHKGCSSAGPRGQLHGDSPQPSARFLLAPSSQLSLRAACSSLQPQRKEAGVLTVTSGLAFGKLLPRSGDREGVTGTAGAGPCCVWAEDTAPPP